MSKILWDEYDGSGTDVGYYIDNASNQLTLVHQQRVDGIVKRNQWRRKNEDNSHLRKTGCFYEIADIPNGIALQWRNEYGVDIFNKDHFPAVMALIQSREWNAAVACVDGNFTKKAPRQYSTKPRCSTKHPLASGRATKGSGGLITTGTWSG